MNPDSDPHIFLNLDPDSNCCWLRIQSGSASVSRPRFYEQKILGRLGPTWIRNSNPDPDPLTNLNSNATTPPKHCRLDLLHCKKVLAVLPSPAGMSLTKLSLGGKKLNYSRPGRVWSVTSRLGTGKRLTLYYSVDLRNVVRMNAIFLQFSLL